MARRYDGLVLATALPIVALFTGVIGLLLSKRNAASATTPSLPPGNDVPTPSQSWPTSSSAVINSLAGASAQEFAKTLNAVLDAEVPGLPPRARYIAIAQAAFESGWGKTNVARTANNFWNITAGSLWRGPVLVVPNGDISYAQSDCQKQNRPMTRQPNGRLACKVDQTWRRYQTVNESVADYWQFLGGRYATAREALRAGDVVGFSTALAAKGYYTAPVEEYTKNMKSIVNTVERFVTA